MAPKKSAAKAKEPSPVDNENLYLVCKYILSMLVMSWMLFFVKAAKDDVEVALANVQRLKKKMDSAPGQETPDNSLNQEETALNLNVKCKNP